MGVRFTDAGAELVDVEVDRRPAQGESVDPGLLGGFTERDLAEVGLSVGVTTRLQPEARLGVQHQQHALAVGVDDQCRPREVTRTARSQQRVGMLMREGEHLRAQTLLLLTFE